MMNNVKQFLAVKGTLFYILLSYLFSILIRLILYYQISDNSSYFYNSEVIPLWTPDSGLYGFYANQLLHGVSYPFISEYIPGYLIYWIVNLTGFHLNSVLFFSPIFFSSLVVIPIILLAYNYNLAKIGFYSTLFGSIMTSYYYRTHLGYYDTDMLNVVFSLFSIYFLIRLVSSQKIIYAVVSSIVLILFHLWYHSSASIILSIVITFILYTIIFKRKEIYLYQSIIIISIATIPISIIFKIILLLVLSILFLKINKYKKIDYRYYISLFTILLVAVLFLTDISKSYERADNYLNKDNLIELHSKEGTLKLIGDLKIVSEARGIDFSVLAHRVSGNTVLFIMALFGYLALLLRYRSMFLTLPLLFLTFISLWAGLRFTIYGVAIFAFALVYAIELIFYNILRLKNFSYKISNILVILSILPIIIFSIFSILKYNKKLSPFYFSSTEDIKALDRLKNSSTSNDFIIAPWDYGWPLWYYSNISTIVDNGKHAEDNFIVSKILLSESEQFVKNASLFFVNRYKRDSSSKIMKSFIKDYSIEYLQKLEDKNYILPKIDKDTYILLHRSMLDTYESIEEASNVNLRTGKKYRSNLYNKIFLSKEYNRTQKILATTTQLSIDIENGRILSTNPNEDANIKEITIAKNSKIEFKKHYNSPNNIYIIIDGRKVLITNKKLYNSFLIQALVFDKYNHQLFTEFAKTKNLLILKVRDN